MLVYHAAWLRYRPTAQAPGQNVTRLSFFASALRFRGPYCSSLRCGVQALDADACDAVVVHLQDAKAPASIFDRLARLGNVGELEEQKTSQCFEARIAGQLKSVLCIQVADGGGAVHFQNSELGCLTGPLHIVLVADLA